MASLVISILIAICFCVGALDYALKYRFGFGEKFEQGIQAFGMLALSMLGIMGLVPLIKEVLAPLIVPLFSAIHADPSLFAGLLLPIDMGGYALSVELAVNKEMGLLSGCVLSCIVGCTVVFNMPIALGIVSKESQKALSLGILSGFAAAPVSMLTAGLIMGIDILVLLLNLVPVAAVSAILIVCLAKAPVASAKVFSVFGRFVTIISLVGLVLLALKLLCGFEPVPGMASLDDSLIIVGHIALTLAGAYVLVEILGRILQKPLTLLGDKTGLGSAALLGMLACLAHAIPLYQMLDTMSERGKTVAASFSVSASYVLASHLAFVAQVEPSMVVPMIIGKLSGGICAVIIALIITRSAPTLQANEI
ncbi:MAG: ethanolamine utilization protein EutH [Coriobacteriales bacterium]|nr:ethanolamine utilization protein EutH [Coriobacteriales bacterium]